MPDTTPTTEGCCPNCNHPRHLPGTECDGGVDHGPKRWHRCLCLARPGAALSCPPQMNCQGGTLGYSDIWYLQHGHSLMTADGVVSPEALKTTQVLGPSDQQPETTEARCTCGGKGLTHLHADTHEPTAQQPETAPADRIEVWPLKRVLAEVRCGSQEWSWEEEWADLDRRHAETGYLATLEERIQENGITMPVLVGSDGRLWDGHHRLRIAVRLGIEYVPVELTPPALAVEQPADRRARYAEAITGALPLTNKAVNAVLAVADTERENDRLTLENNSRYIKRLDTEYDNLRAELEAHRLALSDALGLGTGAPWDAIRDRAAELHATATTDRAALLRELADEAEESDGHITKQELRRMAALEDRRLADEAQRPECTASISGSCLAERQSDGACDTEASECVHGGEAQQPKCTCGEPDVSGTVHRTDGPCYIDEAQQPETEAAEDGARPHMAPHMAPLTVRCPLCKAPVGLLCTTTQPRSTVHQARTDAYRKHPAP